MKPAGLREGSLARQRVEMGTAQCTSRGAAQAGLWGRHVGTDAPGFSVESQISGPVAVAAAEARGPGGSRTRRPRTSDRRRSPGEGEAQPSQDLAAGAGLQAPKWFSGAPCLWG